MTAFSKATANIWHVYFFLALGTFNLLLTLFEQFVLGGSGFVVYGVLLTIWCYIGGFTILLTNQTHAMYLRYVLRHKWFVFKFCMPLGVPLYRAILHDWDKFAPSMWNGYAQFFYGPHTWGNKTSRSPSEERVRTPREVADAFDRAWLGHQNRQPHHWQFWVLMKDDGMTFALDMPMAYRREMLADWRGAGAALGFTDTAAWYLKNRSNMCLHPDTRSWIEGQLLVRN
jgi:hypothetical protein